MIAPRACPYLAATTSLGCHFLPVLGSSAGVFLFVPFHLVDLLAAQILTTSIPASPTASWDLVMILHFI